MRVTLENGKTIDLSKGHDISITLTNSENNPRAWYVNPPRFEPVMENGWVGEVAQGGAVNFRDIFFNPHGHGTHTECLGHITKEIYSVNERLKEFFFNAKVISITPEEVQNGEETDHIVQYEAVKAALGSTPVDAVVLRTLPNTEAKKHYNYSSTNPPYLDERIVEIFDELGVKHFLLDLPSVDRESDGGELAFHHKFWNVPENPNHERTITEMIFVDNHIEDGEYLLNLQVAPFDNDASPSRPVLYAFE
ncbi:Kynurenine formamidase [Lishizhenia tianjinensis]|uniref:Kynurenine formamidase n=1 Tax=Lishizhenia tianjinensis TaxID=477690 RepID=A0A1I6ZWD7_9FLAO|nr:cyclase family protein [Lishizhenia tianjinensis]SFT66972.1 Kynurenine formamidase [Lishizhenia tianjinensis]